MSYFDNIIQSIQEIEDETTKELAKTALLQSCACDEKNQVSSIPYDSPGRTIGFEGLIKDGLTKSDAVDYKVCLKRKDAVKFLTAIGKKITDKDFNKVSGESSFYAIFNRSIVRHQGNNYYTYAEICILAKFQTVINLKDL